MITKNKREDNYPIMSNIALINKPVILSFIYSPTYGFIEYDVQINKAKRYEMILYFPSFYANNIREFLEKDNAGALLLDISKKAEKLGLEKKLADFQINVAPVEDKLIVGKNPEQIIKTFQTQLSRRKNSEFIQ